MQLIFGVKMELPLPLIVQLVFIHTEYILTKIIRSIFQIKQMVKLLYGLKEVSCQQKLLVVIGVIRIVFLY